MSTNNISQKQIFSYVTSTFHYWGIKTTQQTLKQAKKNSPSATKDMKITLFYLIVLHMFDYRIKIKDFVPTGIKEDEIEEVIMAYLTECECPLLLQMKGQKDKNNSEDNDETSTEIEYFVGCNLQSSRQLLILCSWVMAISDYFNQILPNAIQCRLTKIQNPQVSEKAVQNLMQNKISKLLKQTGQPCPQQITSLYKSIQSHLYQTDCYKLKKVKLKARLQTSLQKLLNTNISLESLLGNTESQKQTKSQQQLQEIIQNQIENMNQRKYFWTWLEEKILKETQTELKKNHENFQSYQQNQQNIIYHCQIDLQYLSKYIELCEYYEEKHEQLTHRLNQMSLTIKKSKQIEKELIEEFSSTLKNNKPSINKKHLFIALQLKSHLNISLENDHAKKQANQQGNQNNQQKTLQLSKRLKKQVKKYLKSIQTAIKFI